jgi:hypothetical protein
MNTRPTAPIHDHDLDPTRCPLCGGDNRCAMERQKATGQAQPPCWCVSQTFSAELLERLPAEAQGKACICGNCVARFHNSEGLAVRAQP